MRARRDGSSVSGRSTANCAPLIIAHAATNTARNASPCAACAHVRRGRAEMGVACNPWSVGGPFEAVAEVGVEVEVEVEGMWELVLVVGPRVVG